MEKSIIWLESSKKIYNFEAIALYKESETIMAIFKAEGDAELYIYLDDLSVVQRTRPMLKHLTEYKLDFLYE